MVHTDEPRVGQNRDISTVILEAEGFLREMLDGGFFTSVDDFNARLTEVIDEIHANSAMALVRATGRVELCGGHYYQTEQELEFGLRRAWRNARRCIMRSEHESLQLKDLRHVTNSREMAFGIIDAMNVAFGNGAVTPTVVVLPPRKIDSRGPMVISQQLLAFAGYDQGDGNVLGDPANVQLTKDIMELGWRAPKHKTRWDLLPFVVMAEGDAPTIAELPPELRRLVEMRHPRYQEEFESLDLKWVAAPVLSRLGFDIGGVQYTASPFMGWFMEAEIGTRNLADTARYNVLPDVVKALHLKTGAGEPVSNLADVAEHERLALLSRAQVELNYAVNWSFKQAGVSMIDSLSASVAYCEYDDQFNKKYGHRLPADPYWLAPPQGSIIPIWHRGGAPNYQPKPLIARHVQDPMKAWRREVKLFHDNGMIPPKVTIHLSHEPSLPNFNPRPSIPKFVDSTTISQSGSTIHQGLGSMTLLTTNLRISIHYCTAGTTAKKLAAKVHMNLKARLSPDSQALLEPDVKSLDSIDLNRLSSNDLLLMIVSSTGQGELPPNGQMFYKTCQQAAVAGRRHSFHYSLFANGDSRYGKSFLGGPRKLQQALESIESAPFGQGFWNADICEEEMPMKRLSSWLEDLSRGLRGDLTENTPNESPTQAILIPTAESRICDQLRILDTKYYSATVIDISPDEPPVAGGSQVVTLDLGSNKHIELGCLQVLPVNDASKVNAVLEILGLDPNEFADLEGGLCITNKRYLTEFADLEAPFSDFYCLNECIQKEQQADLNISQSASIVLQTLYPDKMPASTSVAIKRGLLLALAPLQPRTYSVASSAPATSLSETPKRQCRRNEVDIMVKPISGGRFSDAFLSKATLPCTLLARSVEAACAQPLLNWTGEAPLITISTGTGFGPVRAFLQHKITKHMTPCIQRVTVYVGLKEADYHMVQHTCQEAHTAGVMGGFFIVASNERKVRVQDQFANHAQQLRKQLLLQRGLVFICSAQTHSDDILSKLSEVLGADSRQVLQDRLIMEIF